MSWHVIPGRCVSIELWCAIAHLRISRFRVWSFGPSRNDAAGRDASPQMLTKKFHAARPCDVCAGLVVARPLVAMEAVLRAGIDENLDLRPLDLDDLDIGQGD